MINDYDSYIKQWTESGTIYLPNSEEKFLSEQLITYIGNKRKLLPFIDASLSKIFKKLNKKMNIFDGFSGSGVCSRLFKKYSKTLFVNDLELYSNIINKCYLTNLSQINLNDICANIDYLNSIAAKPINNGIIKELYSPLDDFNIKKSDRVFYTNENAKIIDTIRQEIIRSFINQDYLYIAPLLIASSINVNTSGVFKGFYKNSKTGIGQFGGNAKNCLKRITGKIKLEYPIFSNYECDIKIYQQNTNVLIKSLKDLDVAYYDPPYNQHPYGSNYFMLNVIADYKKPENISNISGIPNNWNKSLYNKKNEVEQCIDDLVKNTDSKFIIMSYNNEGFVTKENFLKILSKYGRVTIEEQTYSAFKGSRNFKNRSNNVKEFLFVLEK